MVRTKPKLIITNNAENMARKLRGGALLGVAVGFAWLAAYAYWNDLWFMRWLAVYFGGVGAVAGLICFSAAVYTMAHNALFRDRDEMLAAIRILEAERRGAGLSRQGDFR